MDIRVFQDFVDQNATVKSDFLLRHYDSTGLDDLQYALGLIAFTAELILYRKDSFPGPLVISADVVDALTDMRGLQPHILMRLAADPRALGVTPKDMMEAYYAHHVSRLKLGCFLGRREGAILRRSDLGFRPTFGGDGSVNAFYARQSSLAPGSKAGLDHLSTIVKNSYPEATLPRITIIGFHKSILGLGEDARCLFLSLCEIGVSPELIDVSPPGLEAYEDSDDFSCFESVKPTGEVLIFCLPAIEMMRVLMKMRLSIDRERQYIIGYWPWETTSLPAQWRCACDEVDEIWASTSFLRTVYRSMTSKTVTVMPLYVHVTKQQAAGKADLPPGDVFRFLIVFDFNSRVARKNPEGAIKAFQRAFDRQDHRVELVIKTIHAEHHPTEFERLLRSVRDDDRVTIFNKAIARHDVDALIAGSGAYISLHRAEGFGRPLVEAMMLKTLVIATQWSGSADYLTNETGYPVRSVMRTVEAHEYPFAAGEWAEPDIDHAAESMRVAVTDRRAREQRVESAFWHVNENYHLPAVARALGLRLNAIMQPSRAVATRVGSHRQL